MNRIAVDGGVRYAVYDLNPRGKRTIVFVHGWPFNHKIFECQYDVLPEYDIRCVAIDLRGFGESDQPWRGYGYNRLADDLNSCLNDLNLRNVTLCGFSLGAGVCIRYMSRYCNAGRVCRLALMGAAAPSFVQRPGYPYGMSTDQVDDLITGIYNDRPRATAEFCRTCFSQRPSPEYFAWLEDICNEAAGWATLKCAQSLRDEDLRGDLAKIRVPCAIMHGVQDRVCPYAFSEELHKGIANSFVVPFEQSGHCLFYEERNKCNSTLIDFVGR